MAKHQTRFTGFDDKILSMYARGVTTREIQGHIEEVSAVQVSPALISEVTDAVLEEVTAWQNRPQEPIEPMVFLDALMVKMRYEGRVDNRAVYVAISIDLEGQKDVLGPWTPAHQVAKFWPQVLTDLITRGVKDVLIACLDGLKDSPKVQVQFCVLHLVRASLNYVSWKERKAVAGDLKADYRAATEPEAEQQWAHFAERWNARYPTISSLWRRHWAQVIPSFAFPAEIRKVIYTTNAVESLNMSLRKAIKTRGAFPSEDAALRVICLALRKLIAKWDREGWRSNKIARTSRLRGFSLSYPFTRPVRSNHVRNIFTNPAASSPCNSSRLNFIFRFQFGYSAVVPGRFCCSVSFVRSSWFSSISADGVEHSHPITALCSSPVNSVHSATSREKSGGKNPSRTSVSTILRFSSRRSSHCR